VHGQPEIDISDLDAGEGGASEGDGGGKGD